MEIPCVSGSVPLRYRSLCVVKQSIASNSYHMVSNYHFMSISIWSKISTLIPRYQNHENETNGDNFKIQFRSRFIWERWKFVENVNILTFVSGFP